MPTSVFLVGCCEVDYLGIRRMTDGTEISIASNAPDRETAVQQISRNPFHVVIVDAQIPGEDALHVVQSIRNAAKQQPILLFALQENPALWCRAATMGVFGAILKTDPLPKIQQRIEDAAKGRGGWSRDDARRLNSAGSAIIPNASHGIPLTHRERDVLRLLIHGGTNKQIAAKLGISYETVKEHIQHILLKVGVSDRSQAAIWAVHNGVA